MTILRPYQIALLDACRAAVRDGARSLCVVLPTGGGKTAVMSEIMRAAVAKGRRCLVCVHRVELVDQMVAALARNGVAAGALSPRAQAAACAGAPVQVATIQTLIARGTRPPADIVVTDEAHHYCSAEWRDVLRDYQGAHILGPTATPERSDGVGLGGVFDRIVVGARPSELIAGGFLVAPRILRPADPLRHGEIAQRPVDAYMTHARGRRALVFASRVSQALKMMQDFRAAGCWADMVTGETPWEERRKSFASLRSGQISAIVNVSVALEGFDIPEVDCIILSRRFSTAGGFLQAAGRGLRPAPGKSDLLLLDLVGCTHTHGSPADDREFSLEGRGIRKADEGIAQAYCRVCGAPIAPGTACAECGTEPRPDKPLKVVDRPLVPYATKRAEPAEARIATLKRWIAVQRTKGYKVGWVFAKYSAVYGGRVPDDIWRAAQ